MAPSSEAWVPPWLVRLFSCLLRAKNFVTCSLASLSQVLCCYSRGIPLHLSGIQSSKIALHRQLARPLSTV